MPSLFRRPADDRRATKHPHGRRRSWRTRIAVVATATALLGAGATVALNANARAVTLLEDSFSTGTAPDSSVWTRFGGTWKITTDGELAQTRPRASGARLFAGDSDWDLYSFRARVQLNRISRDGAFIGLVAHSTSATTYTRLALTDSGTVELQTVRRGKVSVLSTAPFVTEPGTWHTLRLVVNGKRIVGQVDGVTTVTGYGGQSHGRIGLQTAYASANFDDVSVATAASTPGPTSVTPTPTTPDPTPTTTTTTTTPTTTPTTTSTTTTAAPDPTTTTTGNGGSGSNGDLYNPGPAVAWAPPANISSQLDATLEHAKGHGLATFQNFIFDQIMAEEGNINYCVRWESSSSVTAGQRDAIEAKLQHQLDKWMAAMTENGKGWNEWPYPHVNVKVVGWAVKDRAQLQWNDDSVDIYVGVLDSVGIPQCAEPCGEFFHQDHKYPDCPGGASHHYDMSLWLTDGMTVGHGGDWGQRMSTEYFMNNIAQEDMRIVLHEMGHGFGLDDFYDWVPTPDVGPFVMRPGGTAHVTEFDSWMLRNVWRTIKSRYV